MRLSRVTAAVGLLVLAPLAAAWSQAPPLSSIQLQVAGTNDEWTNSNLVVAVGDMVLITAEGRVRVGRVMGETDANGRGSGEGLLEFKIGVGAAQRAGVRACIAVDQAGALKLRVRDARYTDNEGSYTVTVLHIPAAAIPPAKVMPQ